MGNVLAVELLTSDLVKMAQWGKMASVIVFKTEPLLI